MNENITILAVDDNAANLTMISGILREEYKVACANSGARALTFLEKHMPNLILLDIEMPDMNGYDVIQKIKSKEATAHIPVIFLTGNTDSDSEIKAFSLGAVDFILKPFDKTNVLARVTKHLIGIK